MLAYLGRVREAPPRSLLRRDVPVELISIILRCLRKSREERFPDAPSLRAALAALPTWTPQSEVDPSRTTALRREVEEHYPEGPTAIPDFGPKPTAGSGDGAEPDLGPDPEVGTGTGMGTGTAPSGTLAEPARTWTDELADLTVRHHHPNPHPSAGLPLGPNYPSTRRRRWRRELRFRRWGTSSPTCPRPRHRRSSRPHRGQPRRSRSRRSRPRQNRPRPYRRWDRPALSPSPCRPWRGRPSLPVRAAGRARCGWRPGWARSWPVSRSRWRPACRTGPATSRRPARHLPPPTVLFGRTGFDRHRVGRGAGGR